LKTFTVYSLDYLWITDPKLPPKAQLSDTEVGKFTSVGDLLAPYQEFVKILGLKNPVIMGPSALGLVAAEFAYLYPKQAAGVIMLAGPLVSKNLYNKREEFLEANYNLKLFSGELSKEEEESRTRWLSHQDRLKTYEMMKKCGHGTETSNYLQELLADELLYYREPTRAYEMYQRWHLFNISMRSRLFELLGSFDSDHLCALECPVFDALGLYDGIVPLTAVLDAGFEPKHFEYHIFSKSGHNPQLEEGELFCEKLITWLSNHSLSHSKARLKPRPSSCWATIDKAPKPHAKELTSWPTKSESTPTRKPRSSSTIYGDLVRMQRTGTECAIESLSIMPVTLFERPRTRTSSITPLHAHGSTVITPTPRR
ncbi:MAG TPA: alpha/beta hydrolase, partial [Coxiellaceae bacterium]|nr:alpha/beta hydrolase [Coxiellaceae bacterium]